MKNTTLKEHYLNKNTPKLAACVAVLLAFLALTTMCVKVVSIFSISKNELSESRYVSCISVYMGDTFIGYAESEAEYNYACSLLSEQLYQEYGKVYYVSDFVTAYTVEVPKDSQFLSPQELASLMSEFVEDTSGSYYALVINGNTVCLSFDSATIYSALDKLTEAEEKFISGYINAINRVSCSISDDYAVVLCNGELDSVMSDDVMLRYLSSFKESDYRWIESYKEVLDSCEALADDGTSERELAGKVYGGGRNQTVEKTEDTQEKQNLEYTLVTAENSLIHFTYACSVYQYNYTPIYEEYVDTENRVVGYERVIDEGSDGIAYDHHTLTYSGGELISDELQSSDVVSLCTPKIILRGTRPALEAGVSYGSFMWPICSDPYITSYYGTKRPSVDGAGYHLGLDLYLPVGSEVYAADGGVVTTATYNNSYGNMIIIDHNDGSQTVYAHLSQMFVWVGCKVSGGDLIGYSGKTGNATGPHLHFEVRTEGHTRDPLEYLPDEDDY